MPQTAGGSGRVYSKRETREIRSLFAPPLPEPLDLNKARSEQLASHPLIGKSLAAKIIRLRKRSPLSTPSDLFHAGLVDRTKLRSLENYTFGTVKVRPLLLLIETGQSRLYVDEPFDLRFKWVKSDATQPAILSVDVRFPSGRRSQFHARVDNENAQAGEFVLGSFASGESGEFSVFATLRDDAGGVSRRSATFGVFTRNPVQMFVTPQYLTQSGTAGAPKYNFAESSWYCYADVRWVNGESQTVNLGRRVDVEVSDAGFGQAGVLTFNLSGDVVIPPFSTVYGNWYTFHKGDVIANEFSAKGDLTYKYSMRNSIFNPTRSVVWRTMRTIGYNLIRIGDFSSSEISEYQKAAQNVSSGILRSRDFTVYGTELYKIEGTKELDADKEKWRFIDNDSEILALNSKYSVPNWYLDVFMVEGIAGGLGQSPVNGPVDKKGPKSGIVIGRDKDTVNLGQTFAHESGHHLGLEHADENDGCADTDPASPKISDNFIFSASKKESAVITDCQENKMRQHGLVRSMTP